MRARTLLILLSMMSAFRTIPGCASTMTRARAVSLAEREFKATGRDLDDRIALVTEWPTHWTVMFAEPVNNWDDVTVDVYPDGSAKVVPTNGFSD